METRPRQAVLFADARGREPFADWVDAQADRSVRAIIKARIARLEVGNRGDCRAVGAGVQELRIHLGPGIRIYFAELPGAVLLLTGGSKRTQARDIRQAQAYWQEAQERP